MAYIQGNIEVTSEVRSVPLGQKRKRGRPKKMPNCLTRSPPAQPPRLDSMPTEDPEDDVQHEVEDELLPEEVIEPGPAGCHFCSRRIASQD